MVDTTTDSNVRFLARQDLQSAGAELTIAEIHAATDAAWADIKSGRTVGGKGRPLASRGGVLAAGERRTRFRRDFVDERLGWKLSALYHVNPTHGGPSRSSAQTPSIGILACLVRGRRLSSFWKNEPSGPWRYSDGTAISALRTGTYASKVVHLLCRSQAPVLGLRFRIGTRRPKCGRVLNFACPRPDRRHLHP